ncbi:MULTISPECIES: ead/Ea22-like family protein [unclassified Citrobacter]|uniref:ead/Ea22-like family protein n=1 Tax=unclassified Citrobacter TaxID=2644389 RepID=UPI0020A5F759|nr:MULTISPECIES: ead/Ea22-like family protein [unclassified Citrobacter]
MSNIDKQALREEFQLMQDHYSDPADRELQVIYIAAEALLDELENKQTYQKAFFHQSLMYDVVAEAFEEAKEQIAKDVEIKARLCRENNSLFDRLRAAEKRIAELEALDKPKFVKCWSCKHDIKVLAIVDCDGYCPRCAAPIDLDDEPYAGIGVKGE